MSAPKVYRRRSTGQRVIQVRVTTVVSLQDLAEALAEYAISKGWDASAFPRQPMGSVSRAGILSIWRDRVQMVGALSDPDLTPSAITYDEHGNSDEDERLETVLDWATAQVVRSFGELVEPPTDEEG